jgi:predicted HTH domain antitoxin
MPDSNNHITIPYSYDILASAGLSASELEAKARMAIAAKLFAEGRLTMGQAAKLCGLGKVEFMEKLAREGYSIVNLRADDAADELRFAHGG